jgi:hypothetical protein
VLAAVLAAMRARAVVALVAVMVVGRHMLGVGAVCAVVIAVGVVGMVVICG